MCKEGGGRGLKYEIRATERSERGEEERREKVRTDTEETTWGCFYCKENSKSEAEWQIRLLRPNGLSHAHTHTHNFTRAYAEYESTVQHLCCGCALKGPWFDALPFTKSSNLNEAPCHSWPSLMCNSLISALSDDSGSDKPRVLMKLELVEYSAAGLMFLGIVLFVWASQI